MSLLKLMFPKRTPNTNPEMRTLQSTSVFGAFEQAAAGPMFFVNHAGQRFFMCELNKFADLTPEQIEELVHKIRIDLITIKAGKDGTNGS